MGNEIPTPFVILPLNIYSYFQRVPYGLSFIKFHSISDFDDADQTEKENIITKDTIQVSFQL